MVEDGIAVFKVGPALTFALREALFALNHIENELLKGRNGIELSNFIEVLDETMVNKPENWIKHYHGNDEKLRLSRKYSFRTEAGITCRCPVQQALIDSCAI